MCERLFKQLQIDEGFERLAYLCPAGKVTVGFGRNLTDRGITREEACFLLINDIIKVKGECIERIPFFNSLDEIRQEALINMAFNLGIDGLLKFKNMLNAMYGQNWIRASREAMDSKWATQVGNRARRIANLIQTGSYPD